MGFPIKKRLAQAAAMSPPLASSPSGLDLLSAMASRHAAVPARTVSEASLSGRDASSRATDSSWCTSAAGNDDAASAAKAQKRAKTFPETLRRLLSDPENESIVSWQPNGDAFAIHDAAGFQTYVLPRYFGRKVIFRSFVRKLNRWGFRSVKRSASGREGASFEHGLFRRDAPALMAQMRCRSTAAGRKGGTAAYLNQNAAVSPNASLDALSAVSVAPLPQLAPSAGRAGSSNEEFPQLTTELLLREVQRRRREALFQLVGSMLVEASREAP